ncbi:MAG: peptidylprolyl isomerase [Pseudomonadota bacterium]
MKRAAWNAVLAAAVMCSQPSLAALEEAALGPQAALVVDGWRLSKPALQVLHRLVQQQDQQAALGDVVAAVVRDRVLGEQAGRSPGDAVLFDDARVAFSPGATAEAALVSMLERVYRQPLQAAWGDGERFVVRRHALPARQLTAALGAGSTLRLDDRLFAAQRAALRALPLLDYRLRPGALQTVNALDVWQRLEVHGRSALRAGDLAFAQHQAMRLLRQAFVLQWVQAEGGLHARDLRQLQALMLSRERLAAWARWQGASVDPHQASPVLERLQREVTPDEVTRYHAEHLQEFERIERVRARHIRCESRACADAAQAALAAGTPFDEVARRHSTAPTRAQGGSLGWLDATQAREDWLAQFAFAQPPGPPSPPVREPGAQPQAWQIVQVDERVMGVHEVHGETVRFAASQAIARRKAAQQFAQGSERLLRAARIEIDPQQLGFGAAALRERGLP